MQYLESKIKLENIVIELFKEVPAFSRASVFDKGDESYPVFSEFGDFIIKNIDNNNLLTESFQFISRMLELKSEKIETLIVIEIFWPIYYLGETTINKVKPFLSKEAIKVFNNSFKEYLK